MSDRAVERGFTHHPATYGLRPGRPRGSASPTLAHLSGVRKVAARKGISALSYHLLQSPVARLRHRYGFSRRRAARILGLPERYLRVLEMRTRDITPEVLKHIEEAFAPTEFRQLTIFEALREIAEGAGFNVE